MINNILKFALEYMEKYKYPIIPLNPINKKPLVPWKAYQTRIATQVEIEEWWKKWPNAMIGAVTGKISGDFVIDIDGPEGEQALTRFFSFPILTPTDITPRGGKHYHFKYPEEDLTIRAGIFRHVDYRGQGGYVGMPPSINSIGQKYFWIEGFSLQDLPLGALPIDFIKYIKYNNIYYREDLKEKERESTKEKEKEYISTVYNIDNLHAKSCRQDVDNSDKSRQFENEQSTNVYNMFEEGTRDEDLFHIANQLVKAGTHEVVIEQVLEKLALSCRPPFPEREIRAKIKSAFDRAKRKERNLAQEVEEWISLQEGYFLSTDIEKSLHLSTREDQKNLWITLSRLCEKGIIEKYGSRRGCYRTVESTFSEINLEEEGGIILNLKWPFGIEKFYTCFPKSLAIIAGSPNVGKTAFCLNFCLLNIKDYKVNYISSEMGALELKSRLKLFENPLSDWNKVRFLSLSSNFVDAINADEINIIDFMEIHDEFWKIGGWIREIYDKLDKGMCLIALQKTSQRDIAKGGEITLEKPRLYLAMGREKDGDNLIKVIKCKNWANPERNPNDLSMSFKLVKGCRFIPLSEWGKPWDDF